MQTSRPNVYKLRYRKRPLKRAILIMNSEFLNVQWKTRYLRYPWNVTRTTRAPFYIKYKRETTEIGPENASGTNPFPGISLAD